MTERAATSRPVGLESKRTSERVLQRACACGQHTRAGGGCSGCKEKRLQRKAAMQAEPATVSPLVQEVLHSPGRPLEAATRAFMEPRFGHDFSRVRVHTDAKAAESARAVNALAYTVGRDVVFRNGNWASGTSTGRKLLAHELTHVIQQENATGNSVQRLSLENASDDRFEREANEHAIRVSHGQDSGPDPALTQAVQPILQRQADISQAPADIRGCLLVAGSGHPLGLNYLFEQSRSALSPADQADLADFARLWLEDEDQPEINIHGFASVEGRQAFNWRLSCDRAEAVKAVLIRSGVPGGKIVTIAHGESTEFSATGLEENRRVIVTTVEPEQPVTRQRKPYPKVRVWVNSFIPHVLVVGPPGHECFAGDNRGFSSDPNASSRTHQLAEVTPGQTSLTESIRRIGTTHEVECDTANVIDTGRASEDELSNGAIIGQRSSAQADVFLNASASNPLVTGAPAIDLEAEFHLDLAARICRFNMEHDGFPGYEAYIAAEGGPTITIYTYDPRDHGETITDLFPPMDWEAQERVSF